MSALKVRLYGDPVLLQVAEDVDRFDQEIKDLAEDMIETARRDEGVGLAAPQVGVLRRLIVINAPIDGETFGVYVNPIILEETGRISEEEGCLSLPDVRSKVERAERLKVRAFDTDGRRIELDVNGLQARVFQHEIDHLDGILFIQRLPRARRFLLRSELERIKKRSLETGGTGERS